jgi:parallel beta-helix repeat protein
VITGAGWSGIGSANASYVVIDGFTIIGPSPDPTSWLAAALANGSATSADRLYNGNGIAFDGRNQGTAFPHHITIRNCSVSRWGGAGISLLLTDYVTIEDCTVFDNSWYTRYATSGISIGGRDLDAGSGYRNVIRRNTVFNNFTQVPWNVLSPPAVSDGNGIIVDDNRNTQANKGYTIPYTGRTLISDNLVVGNGGSGIHAYLSDRVDIVRNTAYMNSRMLDYGEIFAIQGSDVRIMDNILWGRPGRIITKGSVHNTAVVQDSNIYHGDGSVSITPGPRDLRTDPLLRQPGLDPAAWDFRLLAASPARDSASATFAGISPGDITRAARPVGAGGDRGAHEYAGDAGPSVITATAAPAVMTLP